MRHYNRLEIFVLDSRDIGHPNMHYIPDKRISDIFDSIIKEDDDHVRDFARLHREKCAALELMFAVRHPEWREVYQMCRNSPDIYNLKKTVKIMDSLWFCVFACPECNEQYEVKVRD